MLEVPYCPPIFNPLLDWHTTITISIVAMECSQSEEREIQACSDTASHDPSSVSDHFLLEETEDPQTLVSNQLQILYFNACSLVAKLDHLHGQK